jgi:phosphoadenosine phosphosulfate reductase
MHELLEVTLAVKNELTDMFEGLENQDARGVLAWALDQYHPRIALASSFSVEDMVVLDLLMSLRPEARVFTLDTGRLHGETYDLMERTRRRYGINIEVCFPDRQAVAEMVEMKGFYSFRESIENRKECCKIRKVQPLRAKLAELSAWITGLRREQSITRNFLPKAEIDEANGGIIKINPLADWTEEQIWAYIRNHNLPYNELHDRGFPSIGCEPCTRAIEPGEDIRAGRWWWENPEHKECGLHSAKIAR